MSSEKHFNTARAWRIVKLLAEILNNIDEVFNLINEIEFVTRTRMDNEKKILFQIQAHTKKLYEEFSEWIAGEK